MKDECHEMKLWEPAPVTGTTQAHLGPREANRWGSVLGTTPAAGTFHCFKDRYAHLTPDVQMLDINEDQEWGREKQMENEVFSLCWEGWLLQYRPTQRDCFPKINIS